MKADGLAAPVPQLCHHQFRHVLQVDVGKGDLGKAEQVGAESVVSGARDLLNELVTAERRQEPVNRAAAQSRDARNLRDSELRAVDGEGVKDGHRAVERLDGFLSVVLHSGTPFRVVVAPAVHIIRMPLHHFVRGCTNRAEGGAP